jgi:hypothetical protein
MRARMVRPGYQRRGRRTSRREREPGVAVLFSRATYGVRPLISLRALPSRIGRILPGRPLQALVAFSLAVGFALMLADRSWFPRWFFPRLTGFGAIFHAASVIALRFVFPEREGMSAERRKAHRRALRGLQVDLALALLGCLLGSLGLYRLHRLGVPYDKILHFVVPALVTHGLARLLRRRKRRTLFAAAWRAAAILGLAAIAWELAEFTSDALFGTKAFGEEGKHLVLDTSLDLLLGAIGIVVGAAATWWPPARRERLRAVHRR